MDEATTRLTPEAMKNASILLTMLLVLLVNTYAQRFFVKGVMPGLVKG